MIVLSKVNRDIARLLLGLAGIIAMNRTKHLHSDRLHESSNPDSTPCSVNPLVDWNSVKDRKWG